MHKKSSLDCDVIIVNYNAGELLSVCLHSLPIEYISRIIIVDNGSVDDSLIKLNRDLQSEKLYIIKNKSNKGFSFACNQGLSLSTAENILFLNPDTTLGKEAIPRLVDILNESDNTGMVGGLLCNSDGSEQIGGRRMIPTPERAFFKVFGLSFLLKHFFNKHIDFNLEGQPLPKMPVAVEAISGACMLVKKKALEAVGLWDEGYFLHCEDLDLCMRFRQNNWDILFVPDVKITHTAGACSKTRPLFVEWHKHYGMLRFYKKYFRHHYPIVLWGLVAVSVMVRFSVVAFCCTLKRLLFKYRLVNG